MKLRFLPIFASLVLILCLFSCSKSDSNNNNNTKKSSLSYEVNGTLIQCDVITLGVVGGATDNTEISGSKTGTNNSISLAVEKDVVGNFALYDMYIQYGGVEYNRTVVVTNVVTNNAEKIKGTFSGEFTALGIGSITVTNGQVEAFR